METVEEKLIGAVWALLTGRVNGVLAECDDTVPFIEGRETSESCRSRPSVRLATAERTEKERIVKIDAYLVNVAFGGTEKDCYRYAWALEKAIDEDRTLDGITDYTAIEKKVYQKINYEDFCVCISLRITVETMSN
jgi:hypothetical protein